MEKITGYCVDTDILIDYLRGFSNARDFFLTSNRTIEMSISTVSIVEIYAGKDTLDAQKKSAMDLFLKNFQTITLDEEIAKLAGELRRDYKLPFADMIVAASAITNNLRLVTRNTKHFVNIKNLEITWHLYKNTYMGNQARTVIGPIDEIVAIKNTYEDELLPVVITTNSNSFAFEDVKSHLKF